MTSETQKLSGYPIPAVIDPQAQRKICIGIPDHDDYYRAVIAQLVILTKWWKWKRTDTIDQSARRAAAVMREYLEYAPVGQPQLDCGGSAVLDCNEVIQCIEDAGILDDLEQQIANNTTNIENLYPTVINNYERTTIIEERTGTSDFENFVPALIWERRFSQRFNSPEGLRISIEPGFKAFRIVASVQSADSVPRFVYCYLNGDFAGANYRGHETSRNKDIDNPVIGVSNTVGDESTKQIVATMYDYETNLNKVMLSDSLGMNPAESTTRVQGGFAFYWRNNQPVTFIDIALSTVQYTSVDIEIHYLQEILVPIAQPYDPPPPPPPPIETGIEALTITFNPADAGIFTTAFGTVLPTGGNPDYHLYLLQAAGEPVPFSLDCIVDLEADRQVQSVQLDYNLRVDNGLEFQDVNIRIQARTAADQVITIEDYNATNMSENTWHTAIIPIQASGVRKIYVTFFGYEDVNTFEYELRLDNIITTWTT